MNTTCDTPHLWEQYRDARRVQYDQWANNPSAYKLDTTLPPISTWGLDTLFARHLLYQQRSNVKSSSDIFSVVTASPNPTEGETTVTFGMTHDAYVKLELFNLLGNKQPFSFEQFFASGNHSVPLSMQGLPSGTYYARLSTSYGEAQTVKLVKE